jgi:hypothetical protein
MSTVLFHEAPLMLLLFQYIIHKRRDLKIQVLTKPVVQNGMPFILRVKE